jgi:hypothetical protein
MIQETRTRTLDMLYEWVPEKMVEVHLEKPDDFLKVRETLTRMGIVGKRAGENGKQILTQSCHILHKKGKYYVLHFKELFCLDGRESDLTIGDIERRNLIIQLLEDWGLVKIANANLTSMKAPISSVRVISHKEKQNFVLASKYQVGTKK